MVPVRIIISPAKKMEDDLDSIPPESLPLFIKETETILQVLQGKDYPSLKALWGCNDAIATLNYQRLQKMDLYRQLTPAILAYKGIQYQYMAPQVFEYEHFAYIKEHLRILSAFYGLLRPFDGVRPHRLEMGAKLSIGQAKDLYAFWGDKLARQLCAETDLIVNLASKEYSKAVSSHLPPSARFLTCTFGEMMGGKVIEKGTLCKMVRGEMVRWLAENAITDPEDIKEFNGQGYAYSKELSTKDHYVFVKMKKA